MNKKELEIIIQEQNEEIGAGGDFLERKIAPIYLETKKIVAISGVRRCGKSTLLKQIAKSLSGFYYLNFEDERFLNFGFQDFDALLELFPAIYGQQKTFLFDEIQDIKGWEKFVSRLYRMGYKVFVTGSNAKLLSSELSTYLTGRHLVLKLFPFSFAEFLIYKKFPIKKVYLTKEKAILRKHFQQFVKLGGFPEIVQSGQAAGLDQLYQDILLKDLLVRFKVRDTKSFRELSFFYLSNVGNKISFNRLKKLLKFQSVSTVKNYTDYLESSYLFFLLNKYDYSLKKQIINEKKIYIIDTGLANNISFSFSANQGRYLENIVFLELQRRNQETFYFAEKQECDFVVRKGRKIVAAIQVTETLHQLNYEREVNGLLAAMDKFNLKTGLILTNDDEDELRPKGKRIKIRPLWQWLLDF